MCYFFIQQRLIDNLHHCFHVVERKARYVHGINVLHILTIFNRKDYVGYSGTLGGKNLLLYTAHRQHFASQSNFTLRCVKAETMDVAIVMPADGPSLGIAPSGTCT